MSEINMNVTLKINPDIYANNFRARIWADLISLRVVLKSIEDKTYNDFQNSSSGGVSVQAQAPTLNNGLVDYEVIKAFISMMRNVNDYIDQLIAVILVSEKRVQAPKAKRSEEVSTFMSGVIDQELKANFQKTKEDLPTKLKHFSGKYTDFTRYMTTYN
jgi:hypothetical protein